MRLSVSELAQAKYVTPAFNFKRKCVKLAGSFASSKIREALSLPVGDLQKMAQKCTKIGNARAQLLFCLFNLLFGGSLVAVAIVVCLRSLVS